MCAVSGDWYALFRCVKNEFVEISSLSVLPPKDKNKPNFRRIVDTLLGWCSLKISFVVQYHRADTCLVCNNYNH